MQVTVLVRFRDKYTGQVYKAGGILELEESRVNEILEKGKFISPIENEETDLEITKWTVPQLKEFARLNNIDLEGATKKADIIAKIESK